MSFKKCKVVMLSTNEKAHLMLSGNILHTNYIQHNNSDLDINQHLYITSDEEIKKGDYVYNTNSLIPQPEFIDNTKLLHIHKLCAFSRPIIATTDTSLKIKTFYEIEANQEISLPQPSNQFIEKYIEEYNKGNVITDVLVKYKLDCNCDNYDVICECSLNEILKVNHKDNTITIKKVKDSWNREEVIELISDWTRMKSGLNINLPNNFDNWIETNL